MVVAKAFREPSFRGSLDDRPDALCPYRLGSIGQSLSFLGRATRDGADQAEPSDSPGMCQREALGDHAAERKADEVGHANRFVVQHREDIGDEIIEVPHIVPVWYRY